MDLYAFRDINKAASAENRAIKGTKFVVVDGDDCAKIRTKNGTVTIKPFSGINKNDAIKVRQDAEIKYFGEYRYRENPNLIQDNT